MLKAGWLLLIGGLALMGAYASFRFIVDFFVGSDIPLVIRIGLPAALVGIILLLVGAIQQRHRSAKGESFKDVEK
jgi:hypothetical protein